MLFGQPDTVLASVTAAAEAAAASTAYLTNDLDFDTSPDLDPSADLSSLAVAEDPIFLEKLARRIDKTTITPLHDPRPGKKCLVLDIDYTIFDLGTPGETMTEKARPYLHEFMTACYAFYDIVIWSATSMKWVVGKMTELGCMNHSEYKLTCLIDGMSMVTVTTNEYGTFNCKPLQVLWAKYPEVYTPDNTVMLDDLRRNFVANPRQGLRIRMFKHAKSRGLDDDELLRLKVGAEGGLLRAVAIIDNVTSQHVHMHYYCCCY